MADQFPVLTEPQTNRRLKQLNQSQHCENLGVREHLAEEVTFNVKLERERSRHQLSWWAGGKGVSVAVGREYSTSKELQVQMHGRRREPRTWGNLK